MITRPCRACGKQIAFLDSATNSAKMVPVDISSVREGDKVYDKTRHVSHFKTCSDPARFSKAKPAPKADPKPEQGTLL